MDRRPGTSSGRPQTASFAPYTDMPTTAFDPDYYDDYRNQPMFDDAFIEEDEESEDEDVFAYLPPTTAEQEQHSQHSAQQQQQQQHVQPTQPTQFHSDNTYPDPFPAPLYPSDHPVLPPPSTAIIHPSRPSQVPFSAPNPHLSSRRPPTAQHSVPRSALTTSDSNQSSLVLTSENAGQDVYHMRSLTSPPPLTTATSTEFGSSPLSPPTPAAIGYSTAGRGNITLTRSANSSREVHITLPSRDGNSPSSPLATSNPAPPDGMLSTTTQSVTLPSVRYDDDTQARTETTNKYHHPMGKRSSSTSDLGAPSDDLDYHDIDELVDPDKLASSSYVGPQTRSPHSHLTPGATIGMDLGGVPPMYYPDYGTLEDEEDSPYPEVRASVSNIDDPDMPALTLRMWLISLSLCSAGAAANTFFNFRNPAPTIAPLVLLLVAHPVGKFLAYTMPITSWLIRLPAWLFFWRRWSMPGSSKANGGLSDGSDDPWEWELNLNPGPFNIKEHVLIYIMTNVSIQPAYAMNAIVVADRYYNINLSVGFNILLVVATQLTGFGIAGMCRRFLVWPASLIWPQNLVVCTLLNTLHAEDDADEQPGGISRYRFFLIITGGSFIWYFAPGYLFQALSVFSWVCWFAPRNVVVNQVFGVRSGLGLGFFTFDWAQISWIGSPLMVPWWAQVHIMIGFVLCYWIIAPALYYSNVWHFAHFPMISTQPFDRFGQRYVIDRALHASNKTFDPIAYAAYSPLYLPVNYALTYFIAFTLTTCILVHTALYHGPTLWRGIKRIKTEDDDIHAKLMRSYPEVPDLWYLTVFVFFFVMGLLACVLTKETGVPAWALFVAIVLPLIYVLPSSFVYAFTGQSVSINLISECIGGVLFPGRPFTNMVFKAYSTQTMAVAINFLQDLKLGHYMKISPRATFIAQLVATLVCALVQVAVQHSLFENVKDICEEDQAFFLTCPNNQVYYTASAIWGLIGPTRQFGKGTLYQPELYALAVGVVIPIPFWWYQRKRPQTRLKYISTPVLINGPSLIPPSTGIHYSSWFIVGFIFQYWIRRRNFRWWSKFNYILSAGLDSGTLTSIIFIFLTLQLPKNGTISIRWWGNSVFRHTADYNGTALLSTPPEGFT